MDIIELFVLCGLCKSKTEAKNLRKQGGLYINNIQIGQTQEKIDNSELLFGKYLLLRRGKSNYHFITFSKKEKTVT